jgi:putative tricarboxylic transport membrane protein
VNGTRSASRWIAAGLAVFSVGYLVVAFRIPEFAVGVSVQPGTFPTALGVLMLVLSLVLFWQRPAETGSGSAAPAPSPAESSTEEPATTAEHGTPHVGLGRMANAQVEVLVVLASMIGYVALLRPLGFALTTALYLAAMTWYFGYRRHLINAVVAAAVAAALQVGLGHGLGVSLPAGPLPL